MLDHPNDVPVRGVQSEARHAWPRSVRPSVATMRIQVVSDLHLDAGPSSLPRPERDVDVVVVAGDTAAGVQKSFAFLRAAFPRPLPLVVVLGNREFHGRDMGRERRLARSSAMLHDITLLDETCAEVSGVRFVGATLWTDYLLDGASSQPAAMYAATTGIEDHKRISLLAEPWIRFKPYDALAQHHSNRRFLARELDGVPPRTTIVVTHHAPSRRSLAAGGRSRVLDGCFASDLDDLVTSSGADLWIHGHVHAGCDYVLGRTRVISNPRGRITLSTRFDPSLVVGVPINEWETRSGRPLPGHGGIRMAMGDRH